MEKRASNGRNIAMAAAAGLALCGAAVTFRAATSSALEGPGYAMGTNRAFLGKADGAGQSTKGRMVMLAEDKSLVGLPSLSPPLAVLQSVSPQDGDVQSGQEPAVPHRPTYPVTASPITLPVSPCAPPTPISRARTPQPSAAAD